MTSEHAIVGLWAAGNVVLALAMLPFRPALLPFLLYVAGSAVVAGFAIAVLLAQRTERDGVQPRQARNAVAAVLTALASALVVAGFSYGWWYAALALYPSALAAWQVRRERLPRDRPASPVVASDIEPAGAARFVHDGSSAGVAVPVPDQHPGHGPPPQPQPSERRWKAVLAIIAFRAIVGLLGRAVRRLLRRLRT